MKRFQFHLDSVLNYRRQVLDGCPGRIRRALDRSAGRRPARRTPRTATAVSTGSPERGAAGITAADARPTRAGCGCWSRRSPGRGRLRRSTRRDAEEKREQMLRAHIDKAAQERLREKKWQDYNRSAQKSDEHLMDELVSARRSAAG